MKIQEYTCVVELVEKGYAQLTYSCEGPYDNFGVMVYLPEEGEIDPEWIEDQMRRHARKAFAFWDERHHEDVFAEVTESGRTKEEEAFDCLCEIQVSGTREEVLPVVTPAPEGIPRDWADNEDEEPSL